MSSRTAALLVASCLACAAPAARAGSSNSLLDLNRDGSRLLVVNADNGTVSIVDTDARKVLHEIAVGDKPEGVTFVGDGPLAAVTVYRDDKVLFLDTEAGKVVHTLPVADEPYGIVASADGSKLYVTHEYPGTVSEIDAKTRKVLREMPAGAMVRGLALAPDGKRLYVTEFYSAVMHALDLETGKVVDTWKGHSTDNLARSVVLHPKRPKAYLAHIRSKIEVIDGAGSVFPNLTVYDLVPPAKDAKRRTGISLDTFNSVTVVTNPWEAALSPDGKKFYVVYAATNDMNVCNVLDDDYKEIERVSLARTGKNPRAVRVSADGKRVYVSNALDFTVGVYTAEGRTDGPPIKVCAPPKSPEWVRGKELFGLASYPMSGPKWVACASCHPDGHGDGRVWKNPEGLRKTPPMMGMAHTHPLHWSADRDEAQDFEYTIQSKLMRGAGLLGRGSIKAKRGFDPTELDETTSGRNKDLDAIAIYCNSFTFTLSPHIPAAGKLSEPATRGKELFFSDKVGCAKCHTGPYYTDSVLKKPFNVHDVGTGNDDPAEKIGPKYDTPTLLGVYRTAPYLHTGKARTLKDLLTTCNKDDKHGTTSHLKEADVEDLVAFLKSLPYETPPDETPNTVKYRLAPKKEEK